MGKPSGTTHKQIWMFRRDEDNLRQLKNLLGLQGPSNVTTPDAIGKAISIALTALDLKAWNDKIKEQS